MPTNKVKLLRIKSGMKQKDVAKILGLKPSTYSSKEVGDRRFNIYEAIKLSELFDCDIKDIFLDN